VDWSIFHWLNSSLRGNDGGQDAAEVFNSWAIFVLVVAAVALWFIARPGGSLRLKLATATAAVSAVLALAVNAVLGKLWYHHRPFVDHPKQTVLLVHHGADNGFPSDHASVAFAIAFAVILLDVRLGAAFVLAATAIALDRIFIGVHYPVDVLASAAIGLASALVVGFAGRHSLEWVVRQLSRISDPVIARARRL
jgi:undecaprenyl-diphosphatase